MLYMARIVLYHCSVGLPSCCTWLVLSYIIVQLDFCHAVHGSFCSISLFSWTSVMRYMARFVLYHCLVGLLSCGTWLILSYISVQLDFCDVIHGSFYPISLFSWTSVMLYMARFVIYHCSVGLLSCCTWLVLFYIGVQLDFCRAVHGSLCPISLFSWTSVMLYTARFVLYHCSVGLPSCCTWLFLSYLSV